MGNTQQLLVWGWRLPFMLGLGLFFYSLWAKKWLKTTETFSDLETSPYVHHNPIKYVCSHNRGILFKFILASALQHGSAYLIFVFLPSYLSSEVMRGRSVDAWIDSSAYSTNCINSIIFLPICVIIGYYADRIGTMGFLTLSSIAVIFSAPFLFYGLSISNSSTMNWFLQFLLVMACVPMWGCIYFWYINTLLPDPRTRVTVYGVAYNLGAAVFGGTASLIGTFFVASMGPINGMIMCGLWMSINAVICASTIGYIAFCGEHKRRDNVMESRFEIDRDAKVVNGKWFYTNNCKLDPIDEEFENESESELDSFSDSEFIHFTSSEEIDVQSKYSCDSDL